jgi:hypothetical protein
MPCERKHIEAVRAWMDGLIRAAQIEIEKHPGNDKSAANALFYWADGPEQRAARKALSACDESPWRSMESAPLGVHVLLWAPLHVGRPIIAFKASNGAWQWSGRVVYHPTHWMPLPAAPEVGKP